MVMISMFIVKVPKFTFEKNVTLIKVNINFKFNDLLMTLSRYYE